MVNVWGSKYSFRTKEVRDVKDEDLEKELKSRNWEFLTYKELQEFKRKVELHKIGRLSDRELAELCYDTCGWIYCGN